MSFQWKGWGSDFLGMHISYISKEIQYQVAHEEELSLEADAIMVRPVIWSKGSETVEGPEKSGEIFVVDSDLKNGQS